MGVSEKTSNVVVRSERLAKMRDGTVTMDLDGVDKELRIGLVLEG
jgi:hypothetical protein